MGVQNMPFYGSSAVVFLNLCKYFKRNRSSTELQMKIELRINGRYELELSPESEIERLILSEISDRVDKGQPISFAADQGNRCRLGVDQ